MANKIKGDEYEYYILNNLNCSNAWLWKHIPEKILINCGFFEDQYEYLKLKEKSKNENINFIIDTEIDIIEENNGEYIAIQCKRENELGSFYFMLYNFEKIKSGKIYYTDTINHLVTKLSNNPKVEFIKKVMISSEEIHKKYELEDNYNNLLGETIYNEAISRKIICNYKIYIPSVSLIASNENIKNDINSKINIQDLNNEYVAKSIYLYKCITFHGSRKTIIYCKDTEDLKNLMNTIEILKKYYEMDDILLDKITHETSNTKRHEIIKEFSESETYSLLFSVQILDECIDIPSCDSIFISYHLTSKIRSIQYISHATRINKINPYKIANIYLWCDNYSNILEFLSNLKEYDTDLLTKVFIQDSQLKKLNDTQNELIIKDQTTINNYIISVKEY